MASEFLETFKMKNNFASQFNVSTTLRCLPISMVSATGVAPPQCFVSIDNDKENSRRFSNGTDSTVAAGLYKHRENRADQMEQNKIFKLPKFNKTKAH